MMRNGWLIREQVHSLGCLLLAGALWGSIHAAAPPSLPGEDITQDYYEAVVPRDSIVQKAPKRSIHSPTWLDEAVETWDAPSLSVQLEEDQSFIPMGKGALFVPRMTESDLEPDIEILDSEGVLVARGETGRRYSVLPGIYYVLIGSGSHRQALVRTVSVQESRTTPVVPDWSGLSIEVIDPNGIPIRGEFEIVNLDDFEPYGRGFGPDPDLGEKPRTWILKPGLYKVFSVGESYNTLRNFITVYLHPGRLANVILVEDPNDFRILSGGALDLGVDRSIAQNWKYGLDLGGGALFKAEIDRQGTSDQTSNSTTISLLMNMWVRYERSPFEWSTTLRLNEAFSFIISDKGLQDFTGTEDEPRIRSLYIWRLLDWFGPYARGELQSSLFPKYERLTDEEMEYFLIAQPDSTHTIDISREIRTEPSFSPLEFELGLGANVDIFDLRFVKTRLRTGFGYNFKSVRDRYTLITPRELDHVVDPDSLSRAKILRYVGTPDPSHEAGPEAAFTGEVRVGRWATVSGELNVFSPVAPEPRLLEPDIDLEGTLSWRISRAVTLDYRYNYTLKRPAEEEFREDKSEHRVQLRYSFSSR